MPTVRKMLIRPMQNKASESARGSVKTLQSENAKLVKQKQALQVRVCRMLAA